MGFLQTIGQIGGVILLYFVMLTGVVIIPLGVPGEFLIVAATLVFILVAGSQVISWWVLVGILVLAIVAEILEAVAGFAGAKAKGSFWSGLGAIGGGLAGAIVGSAFGLIIGALLGAFIGTFAGAFGVEYFLTRHTAGAAQVATGAFVGRLIGSAVKVFIALLMMLIVTLALIF